MKTKIKQHGLFTSLLILTAVIYFLPTFNGKTNSMEDVRQSRLTMVEAKEYYEKEGKAPGWTNQIFGGMPNDLIYQGERQTNLIHYFSYHIPFHKSTSYPFQNLLLCFIGFYVALLCFNVSPTLSFFGALAYGFMTFTLSSIEAAHVNKVFAMAMIPPILGGVYLLYRKMFLAGFAVFSYHFALQIFYYHYQITYYTGIILLVFGLFILIHNLLNKDYKSALLLIVVSLFASALSVFSNTQRLITTYDYTQYTMRGGSALSEENPESAAKGLDKEYAFRWSYGIGESLTILVPGLYGGSSNEKISERSAIYKAYQDPRVLDQGWPLYHGSMPSTSGPVYFGAIVILLFLLSFKLVQSPIKWPLLIITLISFALAWGRHFPILNFYLFDNLPFYNKFRTPMMALSIAQVSVLLLAILSFKELLTKKIDLSYVKTNLLKPFYFLAGFLLLLLLAGPTLIGNSNMNDARMFENNPGLVPLIKETRNQLMFSDTLRTLFLISIAFGLIWFYAVKKITAKTFTLVLGGLMVLDLVQVDLRYLSWDDFKYSTSAYEKPFPDRVDNQILQDADPHYRVMDMSRDPFNSNDAAAFHKLVGGYHAAKMSRYQELITHYIVPERTREYALDILNCKYLIGADRNTNQRVHVDRKTALGNAWFVNKMITALSDKEEMDSLKEIIPSREAVINVSNQNIDIPEDITIYDSLAHIELYSYHPDTLRYSYNSNFSRLVVFSEVYYPYWKLYFNGEELPLYQVNYFLRGAVLPKGSGDLEMIYEHLPAEWYATETKIASSILLLLVLGWIGLALFKQPKN